MRGVEGPPPKYIGNWNEVPPDEGRGKTLHINQPSTCSCAHVATIKASGAAVYFNDLNSAHASGFTEHCAQCAGNGPECQTLLP